MPDTRYHLRLRKRDEAWWEAVVEPLVRDRYGGNRTEFLTAAARALAEAHGREDAEAARERLPSFSRSCSNTRTSRFKDRETR